MKRRTHWYGLLILPPSCVHYFLASIACEEVHYLHFRFLPNVCLLLSPTSLPSRLSVGVSTLSSLPANPSSAPHTPALACHHLVLYTSCLRRPAPSLRSCEGGRCLFSRNVLIVPAVSPVPRHHSLHSLGSFCSPTVPYPSRPLVAIGILPPPCALDTTRSPSLSLLRGNSRLRPHLAVISSPCLPSVEL